MRTRGWIILILGCLLLGSTLSAVAAVIAISIAIPIIWLAQAGRIDFLIAKIQEGLRKILKILRR